MSSIGVFNLAFFAVAAGAAVTLFHDPDSRFGKCLRSVALIMVGYAIGHALLG